MTNNRPRSNFPFHTTPTSEDEMTTNNDAEMNDTEEFDDDDDTVDSTSDESVTIEETHTTLATGVQNTATEAEAATAASNPDAVPQDAEAANEQKVSAYRKRLNEKGLDAFPLEAPKELVDMLRVAAEKAGGLALAALTRKLIATHVNSLDLTHEVDGKLVPWKFDVSKLDEARSRTSTRGLTEEQKKARAEQQKQNQKAERELVKQLLAAHRAKLRGGDPNAAALEAQLSANGSGK